MLLFTIALTILSVMLGICLGSNQVSPASFLQAVFSGDTSDPAYRIVVHIRLPRVLGALLAGSALAVSGAILQAVLNNPLASPNIIGVNTGAGLLVFIMLCIVSVPLLSAAPCRLFGRIADCTAYFCPGHGKRRFQNYTGTDRYRHEQHSGRRHELHYDFVSRCLHWRQHLSGGRTGLGYL